MNYFHDMNDLELSAFYTSWNRAVENNLIQQDERIKKALGYFRKNSNIPTADCERNLLMEIAERWKKSTIGKGVI